MPSFAVETVDLFHTAQPPSGVPLGSLNMTEMSSYLRRMARLSTIVPLAAIVLNASSASAQLPLGSAQTFAVLGATTVTNTGPTVVTGNLGVSPRNRAHRLSSGGRAWRSNPRS
jgi:hypothetical protein